MIDVVIGCLLGVLGGAVMSPLSVSYTHLDVYKRQGLRTLTSLMELLLSSVKNIISMVFPGRNLGS